MVNKRTCLCFGGVNLPMSCENFEADGNSSAFCLSTNEILESFSVNLVLSAYLSPLIYLNLFQTHGRITKISETSRNLIFVSLSPYVCSILWWWPQLLPEGQNEKGVSRLLSLHLSYSDNIEAQWSFSNDFLLYKSSSIILHLNMLAQLAHHHLQYTHLNPINIWIYHKPFGLKIKFRSNCFSCISSDEHIKYIRLYIIYIWYMIMIDYVCNYIYVVIYICVYIYTCSFPLS